MSVAASLAMSILDLAGVLTLVPLMQFITGAQKDSGALGTISELLGDPSDEVLATWLAGTVVLAFVLKDLLAIVLRWWQLRFMATFGADMSIRMMRDLMAGPYHRHLTQNSADKAWIADSGVQLAYTSGIGAGLALISEVLRILSRVRSSSRGVTLGHSHSPRLLRHWRRPFVSRASRQVSKPW